MQTTLAPFAAQDPRGQAAAALIRSCVHCGFCTASCPTYQLLGDERDGPRGRIYLIKQFLEGQESGASTQRHLDRCLTCRACETACPSGVQYGALVDIGRELLAEHKPRAPLRRLLRRVLSGLLTGAAFGPLVWLGRRARPLLPAHLAAQLSLAQPAGRWPPAPQARRMLLLKGCVQPALAPQINAAAARVCAALGIELLEVPRAGCCGALHQHLDQQAAARADMRRNIDVWWPQLERGVEAIVVTASGCGTQVKDYGRLLAEDPGYADKAARVSALTRDLAEVLPPLVARLAPRLLPPRARRVVFHPPCSLQHGQQLGGVVESMLQRLGAEVLPFADAQRCCGSAGTYSLLQPELSQTLREAKRAALTAPAPQEILTANIGCMTQLAAPGAIPVRHWIEWLDERLA